MNANKDTASIILQQLGGFRFTAMTGAKFITFDSNKKYANLAFRFQGSQIANYCKIELDETDTYQVTFLKIRGTNCKVVSEHTMVYNDALQPLFTRITGLDTRL